MSIKTHQRSLKIGDWIVIYKKHIINFWMIFINIRLSVALSYTGVLADLLRDDKWIVSLSHHMAALECRFVAIRSVLAYSSQHKRFFLRSIFNNYFRRIRHWMPFARIVRTSQSSNDDNDENCGIFVTREINTKW